MRRRVLVSGAGAMYGFHESDAGDRFRQKIVGMRARILSRFNIPRQVPRMKQGTLSPNSGSAGFTSIW